MKKGQVLLLVFLIVLIIGILGMGLLHMSRMESIQLRRQIHYLQAFNIAEAGIERALWKMTNTPGWTDGYTKEPLGNGFYTVEIEKLSAPNRYKITSTGEVGYLWGNISKTIYLEAEVRSGKWPSAFDYALFWGNPSGNAVPLDLLNGVNIKGDVFVYGNIEISNTASVTDGYVYATGTVTGNGTYQVGELPAPLPERVTFDTSYYDQLIIDASKQPKQDFVLQNGQTYSLEGGTLYVNGDVKFNNNVTINGPGTIVATGNITASVNITFTGSINLISGKKITLYNNAVYQSTGSIIYGKTSIEVSNNCQIGNNVLLYTPGTLTVQNNTATLKGIFWGGTVEILNNVAVSGAIYGDNFTKSQIKNNVAIQYDSTIFEFDPPPGVPPGEGLLVKKIYWSEDNF